jgi:hypothetical protein
MRFVKLKPNSKVPATMHGHHDSTDIQPIGNYGIVLDGEYVVFDLDCDHYERDYLERRLPVTWSQKTSRIDAVGMHYLYKIPKGYKGTNTIIKAKDGTRIADVKFNGYIVGPGSIVDDRPYTVIQRCVPTEIPLEVLDRLLGPAKALKTHSKTKDEFDVMPDGQRDNSLHKIGSTLRGIGYSEKGIAEGLASLVNSGLVEQPEGREVEAEDIKRLAHSCVGYATEIEPTFTIKETTWKNANDLPENQPNIEWILYRFIPQYKLTFQYGKGGIGKSSWIPWLVGKLLKEGLKVGFSATEETFARFSNAVRLSTPDFTKTLFNNLYDLDNDWMFPRDANKLAEGLDKCPLDFIYFDSIYDIFDPKGAGIFTNTRQCLKPLSIIAQEKKVTILGTFHENKSGTFNGSKEMESIPRSLIHATEEEGKLRLHVEKSNNKKPEHDLLSVGDWALETNPDGSIVQEKNESGIWTNSEIFIVQGFSKIEEDSKEEDSSSGMIPISSLAPNTSDDEAYWKVYMCKKDNPTWGWSKISEETGLTRDVVKFRLKKMGKDE